MSYQVLARKWRPRRFAELVGQEHVVRALTHALETNRIHHAFLFTGTRGVGKTTIARIFAKSLNCERGVSADPCGECSTCRDVDAGRYMDLLEIDAASNTGVDDVREVIENAQYAPSRGNYKVYLIDEVHMLSKNAFNALLKTLEEPPPHVKFLLATTDPQKLPVTVLSRCLQFNLKRLSNEQIAAQVKKILEAEQIAAESGAIRAVARAGNGSLRDALSLLDQAIAYGGGSLKTDDVTSMLGTIDRTRVVGLLEAILASDAPALLREIESVAQFAPDFGTVLDEMAELLHRVQLAQFVPGLVRDEDEIVAGEIASRVDAESVQLLYQLAVTGRRDLWLAPSPRAGFEMALLRMLAFKPAGGSGASIGAASPVGAGKVSAAAGAKALDPGVRRDDALPKATAAPAQSTMAAAVSPASTHPTGVIAAQAGIQRLLPDDTTTARSERVAPTPRAVANGKLDATEWAQLIADAGLRGLVRELAVNCVPIAYENDRLRLGMKPSHEHFRNESTTRQLTEAFAPVFGPNLKIQFDSVSANNETLADRNQKQRSARQAQAESAIANDPFVQTLVKEFDAKLVPNSIRPTNPE